MVSITLKEERNKNKGSEGSKDEIWLCEEQNSFEAVTMGNISHWQVISKIIVNYNKNVANNSMMFLARQTVNKANQKWHSAGDWQEAENR